MDDHEIKYVIEKLSLGISNLVKCQNIYKKTNPNATEMSSTQYKFLKSKQNSLSKLQEDIVDLNKLIYYDKRFPKGLRDSWEKIIEKLNRANHDFKLIINKYLS